MDDTEKKRRAEKGKQRLKEIAPEVPVDFSRLIFDPNEVQEVVPFPMFATGDVFGIGILHPAWRDKRDPKTNETVGQEQYDAAILLTDKGPQKVFGGKCDALKVRFETMPSDLSRRCSLERVRQLIERTAPTQDPRSIYERIKAAYEEYLFYNDQRWYSIHALWDIGTYYHQQFHAYPYLELRGLKETAKSKTMTVSGQITFNATPVYTNVTPATLFRETNDKRPTTYLDECENLFKVVKGGKVEHDERVEVLNAGYTREGTVPRQEARGKRYVTVVYRCYSPKMLGSINGLQGATETRAIVHVTTRAPRNDQRGEREIDSHDPRWSVIRDDLYALALQEARRVREIYTALGQANPTRLRKREYQLWRPLLTIARLIGDDVFDLVVEHAEKLALVRQASDINEESLEYRALARAWELFQDPERDRFLIKELFVAFADQEKPPRARTISTRLDSAGLRDFKAPHNIRFGELTGTGYVISAQEFRSIVEPIIPSIFTSQSSQSSQLEAFTDDKKESEGVKKCEDKQESVKQICEDCEDCEDCEVEFAQKEKKTSTPEPLVVTFDTVQSERWIKSSRDILTFLKLRGKASPEDIAAQATLPVEAIEKHIGLLARNGDVFEDPHEKGSWRLLT